MEKQISSAASTTVSNLYPKVQKNFSIQKFKYYLIGSGNYISLSRQAVINVVLYGFPLRILLSFSATVLYFFLLPSVSK